MAAGSALARTTVILLSISLGLACGGPPASVPRHVVFLSMDTTRADHLGFLGNDRVATPRLDALAAEAIAFTDYANVAPTTLVSHTSLFTGKYPHHHGTPRNGFVVNPDNEMLPEILKAAGFRTAGFAASFALAGRFDFAQGFEHYDESFDVLVDGAEVDQNQRSAAAVADAVIRHLDDRGIPERLFLFAHFFDPHRPYAAPPAMATRYDPLGREGLPSIPDLFRGEWTPAERAGHARRHTLQYAAEISYMDSQIGRLLDALDERGILDDAIVVVTNDHGESFWEHGEHFNHGLTVYQPTIRGVWLLRLPGGQRGGERDGRPVSTIDVLPTVLDLLRLPIPGAVDGRPVLTSDVPRDRLRFGQATQPWESVETDPRWRNMTKARFVREGRYKLIQTPYLGTTELYDLDADPAETVNLLLGHLDPATRALAERLRAELEAWAYSARPLPSDFEPVHRQETIDRLRSLGYVQ
jgi:arylsulfatase A-like enzyme